jgi:hypothetical protein
MNFSTRASVSGRGGAAVAQVLDKARIARRQAAEFGPRHAGFGQEFLDLAYQHGALSG